MATTPDTSKYQTGGWYKGRQWNGQVLGAPGVINMPGAQGAGQPVSNEVVAQTNPANVAYLAQQRATAAPVSGTPTTSTNPQGLYDTSGLSQLEADLAQKQKEYADTKAKVNDNPFLSEASRVGRVAKLEQLYNERTLALQNDIKSKKEDLKMMTEAQAKANELKTQVVTANGKSVLINTQTGEVIKDLGKAGVGSGTPKEPKRTDYVDWIKTDARSGKTLDDLMSYYDGYLTRQEIFDLYMSSNYYNNAPEEIAAAKARWGVK
jgi:hypothetical protein